MSGDARQARRAIAGAMFCQMGLGLGGYVFAAFLKPIVTELGWSRTAFSVSNLPFLTAMAFASPLVGVATDRLGPRRIFAAGIVVVAAALVGSRACRRCGSSMRSASCSGWAPRRWATFRRARS